MAFIPLEKLLPKSGGSVYRMMAMASKRAMELADNLPRLIEHPASFKVASMAMEEIAAGKVCLKQFAKNPASSSGKVSKSQEKSKSKAESVEV